MAERWAVVFRENDELQGRFLWVRNADGSIVVFDSQWEARRWVLNKAVFDEAEEEVLYLRISPQNT
ncbi:MAG TPA: hypothetical protein VN416_06485 [Desulfomonilia bacterium]|nr:hypothetical protein [Desulfomonilia bacterium]